MKYMRCQLQLSNSSFGRVFMMSVLMALLVCFATSVEAQKLVDPCPMPGVLSQQSPPDMATVQADIDILTLCVERARLLEAFDTLSKETSTTASLSGGGGSVVPNFNDDNFDIDDSDFSDFPDESSIDQILQDEGLSDLGEPVKVSKKTKEAPPIDTYTVSAINGNVEAGVVATLASPKGNMVRVKVGDVLDDGSVIQSVSVTGGVVALKNGVTKPLNWQ